MEGPDASAVVLELARVTPAGRGRPAGRDGAPEESFSLYFVGPDTVPIPQGTYLFTHPTVGRQAIFVVPVGREAGGLVYEAVFN